MFVHLKKELTHLIAKASKPAGVQEAMKVFDRFEEANAITEEYLRLINPGIPQFTSNKSFISK